MHALCEIAKFYGTDLSSVDNLHFLLSQVGKSYSHSECFYYAFYFAAWIKEEVPRTSRLFSCFDDKIRSRIECGGSLQSMLKDLVEIIGYVKFRRYFDVMGINRVHLFLERKGVESIWDLTELDDIECRHLLD